MSKQEAGGERPGFYAGGSFAQGGARPAFEESGRKGGKSMPDDGYYRCSRHRKWREKVLRRDGYLCQECAKYGRKTPATHAHHIRSVQDAPQLRYALSNGVALCAACHNRIEPRTSRAGRSRCGGSHPPHPGGDTAEGREPAGGAFSNCGKV